MIYIVSIEFRSLFPGKKNVPIDLGEASAAWQYL